MYKFVGIDNRDSRGYFIESPFERDAPDRAIRFANENLIRMMKNNPYSNPHLVFNLQVTDGFRCCGLYSMNHLASSSRLDNPKSAPTAEFVDFFISEFCRVSNYPGYDSPGITDILGCFATYQVKNTPWLHKIGFWDFEISRFTNRVHGPSTLHLIQVRTNEWEDLWKNKYRSAYVDWINIGTKE